MLLALLFLRYEYFKCFVNIYAHIIVDFEIFKHEISSSEGEFDFSLLKLLLFIKKHGDEIKGMRRRKIRIDSECERRYRKFQMDNMQIRS